MSRVNCSLHSSFSTVIPFEDTHTAYDLYSALQYMPFNATLFKYGLSRFKESSSYLPLGWSVDDDIERDAAVTTEAPPR